ncbi:hypothetical protein KEM48_008249 [Puccinia striiformis f. sp. tritici PST-130]|nr:hypothetical protein KEM48_008249 [Puccinia striiformis f. sp. tritici PST-130]
MPPSENNNSDSVGKSTRSSHPSLLAQANLNAAAARRSFPPTTEFLFRTHLEFKTQYLMAIATDNLAAAAMFREQAIRSHRSLEQLIPTNVLTLLTEGWNPITARLPRPVCVRGVASVVCEWENTSQPGMERRTGSMEELDLTRNGREDGTV